MRPLQGTTPLVTPGRGVCVFASVPRHVFGKSSIFFELPQGWETSAISRRKSHIRVKETSFELEDEEKLLNRDSGPGAHQAPEILRGRRNTKSTVNNLKYFKYTFWPSFSSQMATTIKSGGWTEPKHSRHIWPSCDQVEDNCSRKRTCVCGRNFWLPCLDDNDLPWLIAHVPIPPFDFGRVCSASSSAKNVHPRLHNFKEALSQRR